MDFPARADDKPTTGPTTNPVLKTPEGAFEVYEWVIFVTDPGQPQLNANAATLFPSTLPDFVGSRRNPPSSGEGEESKDALKPMPVGIIRFSGNSGGEKVDVLVTNKGGKFLSHWPKGTVRQSGLLWQNVVVGDQPPASNDVVPPGHWFNTLRAPTSPPFVLKDRHGERFLLYDLEPAYKSDLKVTAGPTTRAYSVSHNGKRPLKDLTFYKAEADGWHAETLAELKPAFGATTKPATQPAATTKVASSSGGNVLTRAVREIARTGGIPQEAATAQAEADATAVKEEVVKAQAAVEMKARAVAAAAAANGGPPAPAVEPVPTAPAAAPASQPVASTGPSTKPATTQASTQPAGTAVTLAAAGQKDAMALLAPWKEKLSAAGLPPTDQDLILAILKEQALDAKRLTAVYRLDADQMEELMPLEVTPQPHKTTRVGLVIVRNIDPAIITEIDGLLSQLGDDDWERREAAFDALRALGAAAKPKLDAALKSAKDPEVQYRVERLIAALGQDPNNPNGANGRLRRR